MSIETNIEKMDVHALRYWLESKDPTALKWRHNPDNAKAVGALAEKYAEMPGGKSTYTVGQLHKTEAARLAVERAEAQRVDERANRLKEVARDEWVSAGGSADEFESKWPSLRNDLLTSGRGAQLIADDQQKRRAKAARTF